MVKPRPDSGEVKNETDLRRSWPSMPGLQTADILNTAIPTALALLFLSAMVAIQVRVGNGAIVEPTVGFANESFNDLSLSSCALETIIKVGNRVLSVLSW